MRRGILGVIPFVAILAVHETSWATNGLSTLTTIRGNEAGEHLGRSMAGVGDVNGDGLADFLVGDSRDGWHAGERRCHLYLGQDILGGVPSMTIHQSETDTLEPQSDDDARFGAVVAGGRDVNGDGYDDMVITSPGWYLGTGKIYYYHGSSPPQTSPSAAIAAYGSTWMTLLWTTELRATLVSDANHDGLDEIACLVGPGTRDAGVYLYYGGAPMDSVHDVGFQGPGSPGQQLGTCLADGDLNADGQTDLILGGYWASHISYESDAAWVYLGSTPFDTIPDLKLRPEDFCAGFDVCVPGDLNGDGCDDLVVSYGYFVYPEGYLRSTIFFGGSNVDSIPDLTLGRENPQGSPTLLAGGDINLDGFADIVATEPTQLGDSAYVKIYFGGSPMDSIPDIQFSGPPGLGDAVTWIGDMTGDGWPEFAVSNPQADGGRGEIYIYTMGEVGTEDRPIPKQDLALRVIPNPTRGPAWVSVPGSAGSHATVGIYDLEGRSIRPLMADENQAVSGVWWDGRDLHGCLVPSGAYVIQWDVGCGCGSAHLVAIR